MESSTRCDLHDFEQPSANKLVNEQGFLKSKLFIQKNVVITTGTFSMEISIKSVPNSNFVQPFKHNENLEHQHIIKLVKLLVIRRYEATVTMLLEEEMNAQGSHYAIQSNSSTNDS